MRRIERSQHGGASSKKFHWFSIHFIGLRHGITVTAQDHGVRQSLEDVPSKANVGVVDGNRDQIRAAREQVIADVGHPDLNHSMRNACVCCVSLKKSVWFGMLFVPLMVSKPASSSI